MYSLTVYTVQYTLQYSAIQYSTVQCDCIYSAVQTTIQCSTVQYCTVWLYVQYSTVQCDYVQYSTVQCDCIYSTVHTRDGQSWEEEPLIQEWSSALSSYRGTHQSHTSGIQRPGLSPTRWELQVVPCSTRDRWPGGGSGQCRRNLGRAWSSVLHTRDPGNMTVSSQ